MKDMKTDEGRRVVKNLFQGGEAKKNMCGLSHIRCVQMIVIRNVLQDQPSNKVHENAISNTFSIKDRNVKRLNVKTFLKLERLLHTFI